MPMDGGAGMGTTLSCTRPKGLELGAPRIGGCGCRSRTWNSTSQRDEEPLPCQAVGNGTVLEWLM